MNTMTEPTSTEFIPAVYVDPFPGRKGSDRITEDCPRCGGTGVYGGHTGHTFFTPATGAVDAGCFACAGRGTHSVLVSTRRAAARAAVKAQNKRAEELANPLKEFNANLAAAVLFDASLIALAEESRNTFLESLREQLHRRQLSDKQLAAAVKSIAKDAEFKAARAAEAETSIDAPEGRVTVTGLVRSTKLQDSDYGTQYKMTVRDDRGFTVWSTVPAGILSLELQFHELAGRRVTFTATLTQSDKDSTFAFAKRPTKAAVVAGE